MFVTVWNLTLANDFIESINILTLLPNKEYSLSSEEFTTAISLRKQRSNASDLVFEGNKNMRYYHMMPYKGICYSCWPLTHL